MTSTPSSPKLAEPLKVVAYRVDWPAEIGIAPARFYGADDTHRMNCHISYVQGTGPTPTPLVRLSDAQASIQAMEAEVAGLRESAARPSNAVLVPSSELRKLQADAARYRWLRGQDWFSGPLCVLRDPKAVLTRGGGLGADCPSRDRLDAAIDAAIAAQEVKP